MLRRWLLGARNGERVSPRTAAQLFIRAFVAPHAANGSTVIVAYDDQARAPEARKALHAKRYKKLAGAPVTMNSRTHVFVEGRYGLLCTQTRPAGPAAALDRVPSAEPCCGSSVYRKSEAPASPEVIAASSVAMVGATMAQMFNSPAGKVR